MRKLVGESKGVVEISLANEARQIRAMRSVAEKTRNGDPKAFYLLLGRPSADTDQCMKSLRLCFAIELESRRIEVISGLVLFSCKRRECRMTSASMIGDA
jgi:hypothetical protein